MSVAQNQLAFINDARIHLVRMRLISMHISYRFQDTINHQVKPRTKKTPEEKVEKKSSKTVSHSLNTTLLNS